jgi:hypothetical protein
MFSVYSFYVIYDCLHCKEKVQNKDGKTGAKSAIKSQIQGKGRGKSGGEVDENGMGWKWVIGDTRVRCIDVKGVKRKRSQQKPITVCVIGFWSQ